MGTTRTVTGYKTISFTCKVNPNKFLGVSKPLSEDDLSAEEGKEPAIKTYQHMYAYRHDLNPAHVRLHVQRFISVSVVFHKRKAFG